MFSMKATTSITGLNAETVRAWERRYRAINPKRDEKGRRVYSQQDIERLTLLSHATQRGHAISKVAQLDNQELETILETSHQKSTSSQDLFVTQIVNALVDYELDYCEELLRRAVMAMNPLDLASEVIFPALQKVGILWENGNITIAQEHMFAALVKRMVMSMVNTSRPFYGKHPCIAFATVSGERHEFGILLSYLIAVNNRCCSYYLGPDLPVDELMKVKNKIGADVLVLSFVNTPPSQESIEQLNQLGKYSDQTHTQLWVGGQGVKYLSEQKILPDACSLIKDLNDFNYRSELLVAEPQAWLSRPE